LNNPTFDKVAICNRKYKEGKLLHSETPIAERGSTCERGGGIHRHVRSAGAEKKAGSSGKGKKQFDTIIGRFRQLKNSIDKGSREEGTAEECTCPKKKEIVLPGERGRDAPRVYDVVSCCKNRGQSRPGTLKVGHGVGKNRGQVLPPTGVLVGLPKKKTVRRNGRVETPKDRQDKEGNDSSI